jgi:hypothetical protein
MMELHPHEHESLLGEVRRALERPLAEQQVYDPAAQRRMAKMIARSAQERERSRNA